MVGLLLIALPVPMLGSSVESPKVSLSQFFLAGAGGYADLVRTAARVRVLNVTHVPVDVFQRGCTADSAEPGTHFDVEVVEAFAGPIAISDGTTWDVGTRDTITAGNPNEGPCAGGSLAVGDEAIVFPTGTALDGPGSSRTRLAGFVSRFLCIRDGLVQVDIVDGDRRGGVVERVDVPIDQWRDAFAFLRDRSSFCSAAEAVRDACAQLSCASGETCIFGRGCAAVSMAIDVPPEFFSNLHGRMHPDGTFVNQSSSSSAGGMPDNRCPE
ncbi:MAG: hypothetical protein AB2A00_31885 [Myxococcota bacterium]